MIAKVRNEFSKTLFYNGLLLIWRSWPLSILGCVYERFQNYLEPLQIISSLSLSSPELLGGMKNLNSLESPPSVSTAVGPIRSCSVRQRSVNVSGTANSWFSYCIAGCEFCKT